MTALPASCPKHVIPICGECERCNLADHKLVIHYEDCFRSVELHSLIKAFLAPWRRAPELKRLPPPEGVVAVWAEGANTVEIYGHDYVPKFFHKNFNELV